MTAWDSPDLRALALIGQGLGSFHVIKIEENRMTDQTAPAEQAPWDDEPEQSWDGSPKAAPAARYPEHPYSLADHVYTWSPKLPDGSMMVIRAQSAEELAEKAEALTAVSGRLTAAWGRVTGQQTAATPPPFGPNVSVPAAPGYVGPPAQRQAPQWGAPPQAPAQPWGGAPQAPQGGQAANRQGPKPRPAWPVVYKVNVPFQSKDAFKAFREANKDALKGKVAWAGGGDYWIHGDVVGGFAQYNPVAA